MKLNLKTSAESFRRGLSIALLAASLGATFALTACSDDRNENYNGGNNNGQAVNGYGVTPNLNSCFQEYSDNDSEYFSRFSRNGIRRYEWGQGSFRNEGNRQGVGQRFGQGEGRGQQWRSERQRFPNDRSYQTSRVYRYPSEGLCNCPVGTLPACDSRGLVCVPTNGLQQNQLAWWTYNQQSNDDAFVWSGFVNPYSGNLARSRSRNSCWNQVAQTCNQIGQFQGNMQCRGIAGGQYGIWVQR